MKTLLFLLAASFALGQTPTVSSIAVTNVTHNSATLRFAVNSTTAWVSCELGTISGTYTAQTCNNYQVGSTIASFSLGGLAPSTTYYIRPTAQPNQTNQTNICNANGCGATEQTFTTSADPTLPVEPVAPTAYTPANPDTSGYTVVRMIVGTPECKAASSVGTVTAGDTVQTVLNEITLGYVLEFDQGITCSIPAGNGVNNRGYLLPHITSGSGYVVLRTKTVNASDFPPAGTRTSPTLCVKCATFKATAQFGGAGFADGSVFYTGTGGTQHFVIQNLILTVDQSLSSTNPVCGASCWGEMVSFGNGTSGGDPSSDDNTFDRIVLQGSCNPAVDTYRGMSISAGHTALVNSYVSCIWAQTNFAQGIFLDPAGTGPYTLDNNYIQCVCMTIYQEADTGDANPANDITISHSTLYWPLSSLNAGYLARQQLEFKGGHRILVQGNLIDGCWVYQNECPAVYVAGTNTYNSGDGVSDVNVNYNLIRNAATVFDCRGVPTADGGTPGPNPNVSQRIWLQNNWGYNLGYANHIGAGAGGGGAVSSYIVHRPGCQDMTVTQNTLGWTNPADTRVSGAAFIPVIEELGGGGTLAANYTHTNNIEYMNISASGNYNGGRIFSDFPQTNSSYPQAPAYLINNSSGTNTPAQLLSTYAVHATNGSATASYTWSGNVNICGQEDPGLNNTWSDMTSGDCTTWQSGMPSGDTWATGNTVAARESSVGFTPTTGLCSGCGGAGTNIGTLYTTMGTVTGIAVNASSSTINLAYTAPDSRSCAVDVSSNSWATWIRTTDSGGTNPRTLIVTGLSPSTFYGYRLLCYFSQTSPLFSGPQITDGSISTGGSGSLTCSPATGVTPPTATDIQLQINMMLGTAACTNNLSQSGSCNLTDVQRVINASLPGGSCKIGP